MSFKDLRLYNFRNISSAKLEFSSNKIFLVGDNGQGKTNLLESIYLLCYGASFRSKKLPELISNNASEMSVSGNFVNSDNIINKIDYQIQNKLKKYILNNNPVKDRIEMVKQFPCIVFCHDDIFFVYGNPEKKRWFLDQTLSLYDKDYILLFRDYKKILKTRNLLLKDNQTDLLDVIDYQLVTAGLQIQKLRREAIEQFNIPFSENFRYISGLDKKLSIVYKPSWKTNNSEDLITFLKSKRSIDLQYGMTTTGPHRDNFVYYSDKKDFVLTASTGQLRLISLVLRVSQAVFYTIKTKNKPILLFDDVLLELDNFKKNRFFEKIPENDQSFFTFLSEKTYEDFIDSNTMVLKVNNGQFS